MSPLSLFLSFRGRISRAQWWLGMLAVMLTATVMLAIAFWGDAPIFVLPFILFVFVSVYTLAVKRLHDRGRSGWWSLVFFFIPGVLDRISDRLTEESPLWWALVLIGAALTLWGFVELGFLRGTDGANDYGPDPLAKTGEAQPTEPAKA